MTKFSQVPAKRGLAPRALLTFGLMLAAAAAFAGTTPDKPVSGTLTVDQVQVAFIGSANLGGGTLEYDGKSYDFRIGGLGIGGIGISRIDAVGEVYGLNRLSDFTGVYGQARYGVVVADASTGQLWLENTKGVVIHLDAKRKGIALSLGIDGVIIGFQ